MNPSEEFAALECAKLGATECMALSMFIAMRRLVDAEGGFDAFNARLELALAAGRDTKQYKKWLKAQGVTA